MADVLVLRAAEALRRVSFRDTPRTRQRPLSEMSGPIPIPKTKIDDAEPDAGSLSPEMPRISSTSSVSSSPPEGRKTPHFGPSTPGSPELSAGSPRLSRNPSFSGSSSYQEDWEAFPPLDRLTVFDILDNFALPQQLEKIQDSIHKQTQKVRKQRDALRNGSQYARERVVEEWRRRVPPADEQLDRYRKRMRDSVDKLGRRWNDTKVITLREKVSFIAGVLNVFISGYLIGGWPQYFHLWYTAQILYYMPIRFYTYHRRGYHYFLADLCYFVNFMLMASLWIFPHSKRLFLSTFCLGFGNNAVAIAMWRNSMVFHSFDKITSLFIHIMPCATLHCIVHLVSPEVQKERFPAIYAIRTSPVGSPTHYNLFEMLMWSTIPYAVWQISYYFFITVRRREKIAAGRPTSFTWLRKSYSKVWIGKWVLSLPESLQEPAFMLIQYLYAVLTMLPCPFWFWYRWASVAFLMVVFCWSVYNGATYYIDVFGKRFQNELEKMKAEVQKWQNSPDGIVSPLMTPIVEASSPTGGSELGKAIKAADDQEKAQGSEGGGGSLSKYDAEDHGRSSSVDHIPLLSEDGGDGGLQGNSTSIDGGARDVAKIRKPMELPP